MLLLRSWDPQKSLYPAIAIAKRHRSLFFLHSQASHQYVQFVITIAINYYRPQRSWAKVMFLQVSVILLTGGGGCLPQSMLGCQHPPPPEQTPHTRPPWIRHPPGADTTSPRTRHTTPPDQAPPQDQTPPPRPGTHPPPPPGADTTPPGSRRQHTVNVRTNKRPHYTMDSSHLSPAYNEFG